MRLTEASIRLLAISLNFQREYGYRKFKCPNCGTVFSNNANNWRATGGRSGEFVTLCCKACYVSERNDFSMWHRNVHLDKRILLIAYEKENNNFQDTHKPVKARFYLQPFIQNEPSSNHVESESERS